MITEYVPFRDALEDVSAGNTKIPQAEFLTSGRLAIVDQGRALIAGFTNDCDAAVRSPAPLIVFGDHTRAIKFIDFPFAMGADGVKVLRVREGFDPKFVCHYLQSRRIPGAGYSRHFKFLKDIYLPKPPLPEQRRIAAILDRGDAIRAKRRQVLAHLDSLTQSIFCEMFGAGTPMSPLGASVTFHSGGTPSKNQKDFWDGDLSWFSAKDLKTTDLWKSQDTIATKATQDTSLRLLPSDSVVMVVRGMILAHTIPVATIRVPGTINQDLKALRPRPNVNIDVDFLAEAIRARAGWILARVSTAAHGTKKLDSAVLESIPIPDVGGKAQREFAALVAQVRARRIASQQALAVANDLFASLQSRAFRGEL